MKITIENLLRAKATQRELSRAADRAELAHEWIERLDPDLAPEIAKAIDTLREAERYIGMAIDLDRPERDAQRATARGFRPATVDAHLSPETGTFVKTEGR